VYLLLKAVKEVIRDYHDNLLLGYPGVSKTLELIQRIYAVLNLRALIK
jgi:hypothetical protein